MQALIQLANDHRVSDDELAAAYDSRTVALALDSLYGSVEAADEAYEADAYDFYTDLMDECELIAEA